jgi:2,5-diketo-D-gluconate reductase A
VLNHPAIKAEADELERSPAQLVLRWALARGMAVLPRSADASHMEENLDAAAFELPAAALKRVNALEGTKPIYDGGGGEG